MLPSGEITISLDEKALRDYIEQELNKQIHQQLILVDINKLSGLTCLSVRYLEDDVLTDPRVELHEVRKNRKRWWIAQPTFKAIIDVVSDW